MSGPSLQRLRVFVAVARTGGFSAAARALDMAQSTVSTHIRLLEAEVGAQLFDRTPGRRLTPAGELLLTHAPQVLESYETAVDQLRRLGHGPVEGTLSIGGTVTAGEGLLPPLLVEYGTLFPEVALEVSIQNTSATLRALDSGEIAVALVAASDEDSNHERILVGREPQVVIAAAAHPLAGAACVDAADLRGSTILVRESGSTTRRYQQTLMDCWQIPRARTWTISGTGAIVEAVAAGLGIACVTRVSAESALRLGRVAELALEPAPATRPVHLIHRIGRALSRPEEEFIQLARERSPR
ncbi:LysR family transcriptional regulator [Nocardia sp. NPDC052254]|uniref:LysR family transcriptional regulator n=1 Tax=Nocardia sp. NPDC052254 TaxID=3155681 RepID=UPI00342F72DA